MHRNFSLSGALALGLVFFTAASAAEYSGGLHAGLPLPDASETSSGEKLKVAENSNPPEGGASADAARQRLKQEIDRVRKSANRDKADPKAEAKSAASKPDKKQAPTAAEAAPAAMQKPQVLTVDQEIAHTTGQLILMHFGGVEASESGPKAIRTLIHDGLIAGVVFGPDNIQTKPQLKELIKFFAQSGGEAKPVVAISEFGGPGSSFPRINDFEAWPSERQVAGQGDPEYAYLTYRSLSAFLAGLGFTLNFGPKLGASEARQDATAGFSDSPLEAGVFAKTFILGHKEDGIIAVPVVDDSDFAVQALKTLLVPYPLLPIASATMNGAQSFRPYEGLVRGPRFCLVALTVESDSTEAASPFRSGCDAVVIDGGKDNPAVIRELVERGVSEAIRNGSLSLAALKGSAQKFSSLQSLSASLSTRKAK